MNEFFVFLSSDASQKTHPDNTKSSFTVQLADPIELDPRVDWVVALKEVIFPSKQGDANAIDFKQDKGPIFTYLDILSESRVGDASSKMLRILTSTKAHQTFTDPYYMTTDTRLIKHISVLLTDREGKRYPLESGTVPVILIIHFKGI